MNLFVKALTSGDICKLAGVQISAIHRLVNVGSLKPDVPANGSGHHRLFSVMDAVAVAYAEQNRKHWNADLGFQNLIVRLVSESNPEQLEAEFAESRVMLIPLPIWNGRGKLVGPDGPDDVIPELVNLKLCLERIVAKVKEAGGKLANPRGRQRTLFE